MLETIVPAVKSVDPRFVETTPARPPAEETAGRTFFGTCILSSRKIPKSNLRIIRKQHSITLAVGS
jgi:hypothetical protein